MNRIAPASTLTLALAVLLSPLSADAQAPPPKVVVIGTGGTISGVSRTRTSFQDYKSGEKTIEEMVGELRPEIDEVAEVTTIQFGNLGSGRYTIPEYYDLTMAIEEAARTADAVVVTTGTGTQDEFVYWSELTVRTPKPVVFVGAMRPWTVVGSDAQANLFNAIVLAASGETRCFGSVNMLNDEFHAAKEVWKSDAYRMDTFQDRSVGVLGYIDDLDVRTFRAPPRIQRCDQPEWAWPIDLTRADRDDLPRVEVLMGYQDAGLGEAVRAMADAGVDGIVIAGGGVRDDARAYAESRGVTFVQTERFRSGKDNMMPQKARLLLLAALATTDTPEEALEVYREVSTLEFGVQRPLPSGESTAGR